MEAPVYNTSGKKIDTLEIDEAIFGGEVKYDLIKQAVLAYHAASKQATAKTKSRSETAYSTKKLFRQKGTGNARRGSRNAPLLRGGAHIFAKRPQKRRPRLSKKMRRAALLSAILAKLLGQDLLVVKDLKIAEPKTRKIADLLKNLDIQKSCILALGENDRNIYLSSRNISNLTVRVAMDLNAMDVLNSRKMVMTSEAMNVFCGKGDADEE